MAGHADQLTWLHAITGKLRDRCHMGLEGKTTALLLAVLFGAGAFVVVLQMCDNQQLIYGTQLRHAADVAATLAAGGAPLLAANNQVELTRLCARVTQERSALHVAFVTPQGEVVAEASRGNDTFANGLAQGSPSRPSWRTGARLSRDPTTDRIYLVASYAVPAVTATGELRAAGSPQGGVRMVFDASAAHAAVHIMARRLLQLMSGLSLVTVPLTFLIVRRVVYPVNQMAAAARMFAQDDLSPRVPVRGTDEIAVLGQALNAMADSLTASRNEMMEFNAELGRQVTQRTIELTELATRDPLTNLYNRRHLGEALSCEFAAAVRYHKDMSVMMVDLDNFKGVNDTHGHHIGDEVLMLTAKVITDELRAADIAARYGGDEFIAVLPHTPDTDAGNLAARVRTMLRRRAAQLLPYVAVDVSIGIASLCTTDALSPDDMIREVDKALYTAKRTGKGRIAVAPSRIQAART